MFILATDGRGRWWVLCRVCLPAARKLPRAVVGFIEDLHRRQVLRLSSEGYELRHEMIREAITKKV